MKIYSCHQSHSYIFGKMNSKRVLFGLLPIYSKLAVYIGNPAC